MATEKSSPICFSRRQLQTHWILLSATIPFSHALKQAPNQAKAVTDPPSCFRRADFCLQGDRMLLLAFCTHGLCIHRLAHLQDLWALSYLFIYAMEGSKTERVCINYCFSRSSSYQGEMLSWRFGRHSKDTGLSVALFSSVVMMSFTNAIVSFATPWI